MSTRLLSGLLVAFALAPSLASAQSLYGDVPPSYFAYEHILNLSERGIVKGFSDGTFRPENSLTRAESLKLVLAAAGIKPVAGSTSFFKDVPATHTLKDVIETARANGITSGYGDGTFRPDAPVTRGEFLKLFLSAVKAVQEQPRVATLFKDVPATNTFYKYVYTGVSLKILSGFPDGTFRPNDPLTRGQASKIVYNFLVSKEGGVIPGTYASNSAEEIFLFNLVNASRKAAGKPELILDPKLSAIAREHSADLAQKYKSLDKDAWIKANPNGDPPWTSHLTSDGKTFEERFKEAAERFGVVFAGASENVGWGTYNARSVQETLEVTHDAMMNEPAGADGHKQNILGTSVDVTRVGIGIVISADPKEVYITEDFVLPPK